jgi:hypothetical protein
VIKRVGNANIIRKGQYRSNQEQNKEQKHIVKKNIELEI